MQAYASVLLLILAGPSLPSLAEPFILLKLLLLLSCSALSLPLRVLLVPNIEVRDSQTGYLIPARDGPGALPNGQSSWDVAAAVAAAATPRPAPPVGAAGARPPEYPKYRFRHSKYRFKYSEYELRHPKYKFKLVRVPVFLSSKLSQNGSCSSISQFETQSKWFMFQYFSVQN